MTGARLVTATFVVLLVVFPDGMHDRTDRQRRVGRAVVAVAVAPGIPELLAAEGRPAAEIAGALLSAARGSLRQLAAVLAKGERIDGVGPATARRGPPPQSAAARRERLA